MKSGSQKFREDLLEEKKRESETKSLIESINGLKVELSGFRSEMKEFKRTVEIKIDSLDNLENQIQKVLNCEGPVLCELMLTPGYIFAPKLSAKKLSDGTMVSPTLEDMFPFLDRKEFEENMIKD